MRATESVSGPMDEIRVVEPPRRGPLTVGAKKLARGMATVLVLPRLLLFALNRRFVGDDRAFSAASEAIARIPGLRGVYLRQAFYRRTLASCGRDVYFGWLTVFSKRATRIGDEVYIGRGCRVGWADIGESVMLADGVQVPSGARQHGVSRAPDAPHRDGLQEYRRVTIGEGAWLGTNAVVMADVGARAVVGAGAVVTRGIPADRVAVGIPARVVASDAETSSDT